MNEDINKCNCGPEGCKCVDCGMLISKEEEMGTDKEGTKTCDHCAHCLKNGKAVEQTYVYSSMCQSCGMPMPKDEDKGTNSDGGKSEEFCVYCWKDGMYTQPNMTMEEMNSVCVKGMMDMNGTPEEEAKKMVADYLPKLKRWHE